MESLIRSNPILSAERRPTVKKSDIHMHADFAEILCLVNPDRVLTSADLADRLNERRDVGEEYEEADWLGGLTEEASQPVIDASFLATEQSQLELDAILEQLSARSGLLKTSYPFRLKIEGSSFRLERKRTLRPVHRLYIFLLVASDITRVPKTFYQGAVTSGFERLSLRMMKRLLPVEAEVHHFGTAAERGSRFYGGHISEKIGRLARELRARNSLARESVPSTASGDGGIDLVAWLPMGDSSDGLLTLIGGATCSYKNWHKKLLDTGYARLKNKIDLRVPHVNVCFVPFFIRSANGAWHLESELADAILIDRLRLVLNLGSAQDVLSDIGVDKLIRECIATREGIV